MLSKANTRSHVDVSPHRTLKNKELEESMCETENKGMRVWVDTQKASIYSIKGSIGGI